MVRGMSHHHGASGPPGCDHECDTCGAAFVAGLAACPFCRAGYVGVAAGARCPGCDCLNMTGRAACAHCQVALVLTCVFCAAISSVELDACVRCHERFEGAEERKRQRGAAHRVDPTGSQIFGTLNNILKS